MRTAKEVADILDAHTGVSFSVGATGWDVLPDAVAHLKRIAELEACTRTLIETANEPPDVRTAIIARAQRTLVTI